MGSKPPATVGICIFMGVRGTTLAPQRRSRPRHIPASESGRFGFHAEIGRADRTGLDPFCKTAIPMLGLNCSGGALRALASLLARLPPWQDVTAERFALGSLNADTSFSNPPYIPQKASPIDSDYTRRNFSHVTITYASWGVGPLPSGTALLSFRSILG